MKTVGKRVLVPLIVVFGLLFPIPANAAPAAQLDPPVSPGPPVGAGPATHIVIFKDGVDPDAASTDLAAAKGLTREFVYRYALKGASFVIPPGLEEAVRSDPRVASIERNQVATVFAQTTPTGIDRIDAEGVGASGPVDVDIAIIDTGVDAAHPDLNVYSRTDCTGGIIFASCKDGSGDDGHGHGSHVAGIAAARNNDLGVRGVAPGARIWSVRVLGSDGSGLYSWIIAGVDWVTARATSIEVANMSIGGPPSSSLDTAINNSVSKGVTYVVAAGNNGADASNYSPASNPNAITVSAIADSDGKGGGVGSATGYGPDDTLASFSNYGASVDLAAPGVNIYSTYKGGGYATMSGTSMASPHVAGAAALYKAAHPSASPSQVRSALISAGKPQSDPTYGFTGDTRDSYHEPLVYVGVGSTPPPANTPPTISDIPDQNTNEDTAKSSITFTVGDAETPGSLTVVGTSSDTGLVPNASIVTGGTGSNRTMTITPAPNANGTTTITVTVTDGGGASASDTFIFTVSPVNDAPSFKKGLDQNVTAGAGPQTVAAWATAISAGGGADEAGQALSFVVSNDNNSLFTVQPSVTANGTLTYTPGAATGTTTVTVTLRDDGGTANGGVDTSAPQTFTITVTTSTPGNTVTVSSVSPNSVKGGRTATLTIAGTGFAENAEVSFEGGTGGSPTPGTYLSRTATEIRVTITTTRPQKTNVWDVRVTNPTGGATGVLSKALTVTR